MRLLPTVFLATLLPAATGCVVIPIGDLLKGPALEEVVLVEGDDEKVALIDAETGEILAVMEVHEKYAVDKAIECEQVYRTIDPKHPGVAKVLEQGDVNLAGRVMVLSEGAYPLKYQRLYIRPAESRAMFLEKGWSRVAAFQTRNPMHRSHEHLVKIAVEVTDGAFIHQVLGKLKAGDIPAEVRTRTIQDDDADRGRGSGHGDLRPHPAAAGSDYRRQPGLALAQQLACDDQLLNFGGSLVDPERPHRAVEPVHGVVGQEATPAD